jgi:hypothetical protein
MSGARPHRIHVEEYPCGIGCVSGRGGSGGGGGSDLTFRVLLEQENQRLHTDRIIQVGAAYRMSH